MKLGVSGLHRLVGHGSGHSHALVGSIDWLTTASSSAVRVSRSISARSRLLNTSMVLAVS
jgi:hypothetical protein